MATPVVSGAAALMLQENPSLTPDEIKARMMKTATKQFARFTTATDLRRTATFETQQDIFAVGAGYLDIEGALANRDVVNFQALSPIAQYNAQTKTVTLESANAIIWGDIVTKPIGINLPPTAPQSNAIIWGD